ncbi:sigma 54-interacting transcriptional regulator [Aneurinibacillus sp. Ricciae_BoGa-3]|uniref:sigma-54 interaction domain-containing protein n=1 Tax=Aneurinibacillus sp. Ricciae_BoGa-3 TaxID=3022697 RepID=UPI0023421C00|nr:sigma 54-interacting transcriptional regulator [Aneurinibacillus sp. Ricciae_BoGa-3]WCK55705.1 sigma 54-interacting transcriptional regulator [Aneurinibacillus sp. Ricciae_BoGa-3]
MRNLHTLFTSIFESSYDGIYVADANGNGVMVNEAYTRITGMQKEELIGKNLKDLVREGIISESVSLKVLTYNKPLTIIQTVRGKEVLATGSPVYNQQGQIEYIVTNVRDISELNRLKVELQQSKALTQKYINEIKEFKMKEKMQLLLDGVIAQSEEMIRVLHLIEKVARVDSTVLLLGESGVGKEVIAKLIHRASGRSQGPLIKVNCAAIPHHLLESELFGYEKGAFTGADSRGKPGLFEQAEGGTIFLDEIGDMPLDLQVKLLRVLQELEITRVGGRKSIKVNARVLSATHQSLEEMVAKGTFRQDLYYRLNIVPIKIPPLRERSSDIVPLACFFLNKMNQKYGLEKTFHPETLMFMEQYAWPGNIREMENLIERLAITVDHREIKITDLPFSLPETERDSRKTTLKELLEHVERDMIEQQLAEHKTTRKTAKVLGISQSALVKKIQKLGIK